MWLCSFTKTSENPRTNLSCVEESVRTVSVSAAAVNTGSCAVCPDAGWRGLASNPSWERLCWGTRLTRAWSCCWMWSLCLRWWFQTCFLGIIFHSLSASFCSSDLVLFFKCSFCLERVYKLDYNDPKVKKCETYKLPESVCCFFSLWKHH